VQFANELQRHRPHDKLNAIRQAALAPAAACADDERRHRRPAISR
jgi:hypothetical protein